MRATLTVLYNKIIKIKIWNRFNASYIISETLSSIASVNFFGLFLTNELRVFSCTFWV